MQWKQYASFSFLKLLKRFRDCTPTQLTEKFDYLNSPEGYFDVEELELLQFIKPFTNKRNTNWVNLSLWDVKESLELLKLCRKHKLNLKELKRIKKISKDFQNQKLSRVISKKLLEVME